MPNSRPSIHRDRRPACVGQLLLLMPVARDQASGRFTRWFTGMPREWLAFRRDNRGRFASLAAAS